MLKKTILLFIKACIIGILINIGIARVPATATPGEDGVVQQTGVDAGQAP